MPNNQIPRVEFVLLRRPLVEQATGYSRSTLYSRMAEGLWPKPVSLGARAVAWPAHEVAAMNAARIAGTGEKQLRDLVQRLEAKRLQLG